MCLETTMADEETQDTVACKNQLASRQPAPWLILDGTIILINCTQDYEIVYSPTVADRTPPYLKRLKYCTFLSELGQVNLVALKVRNLQRIDPVLLSFMPRFQKFCVHSISGVISLRLFFTVILFYSATVPESSSNNSYCHRLGILLSQWQVSVICFSPPQPSHSNITSTFSYAPSFFYRQEAARRLLKDPSQPQLSFQCQDRAVACHSMLMARSPAVLLELRLLATQAPLFSEQ